MAKLQKTATPVKSKEKSSLLADIDIDKDFLGSWKPMSMADDGMDFDFGSTTKGNKKAFKFDNIDMDFSLDADFDKLPSFKTNMPGLDISSPKKKSGKSEESSKVISSGGEPRAKKDSFAFSFDFDEFADLDFESKKTKVDENSNKSKQKEGYSHTSDSGLSGDFLAKDDASKNGNISSKLPAPPGVTISKVETQMDNIKDPNPRNVDDHMSSVLDESSEEQEIQRTVSPEKIISGGLQEPIKVPHPLEKRSSQEPPSQEDMQEPYGQSFVDNVSTEGIFSDMLEEPRNMVNMVSLSTQDEQNGNVSPVAEAVPTGGELLENLSANKNSQHQKGEMCESRDDNVVIGRIDGFDDTSKVDMMHENSAHEEMVDKRNTDSFSKLHEDSLDSGSTIGELVPEKEKGSIPVRSKYFKRENGSGSELQHSSLYSTKLISIGNKKMNPLPNNPSLEKREFGPRSVESKFTGISRSLPKVLDNTRKSLNADKPRNEPIATNIAYDIGPTNDEPVSRASDQNPERINTPRSDVRPSSSIELLRKDLSKNILNPGLQATNMTSTLNIRKVNTISPTKSEMNTSEVSLRVSRATEPKLKPPNSLITKGLTSMKSKEQGPESQGITVLKRTPFVDTKKQITSTPTLKRKTFEESADIPRLTPVKRLSASPGSNNIRSSLERAVEEKVYNHASQSGAKSPRLDVSLTEMDISSSIENDGNFEKAEACSKELEDICNMLKKKHDEAKDILVRALVNNNNLLMLNHPIYQDKILMVQKFAELLISK